jgi:RNA recognition motif-containing protein
MSNKLYVGNLSFQAGDEALEELFASQGQVLSAKVVTDRETGRARGFGFVEMASAEEAQKAIQNLDGQDFMGRSIRVSIAQPREDRPRTGGGGGGQGGGGRRFSRNNW